MSNDEHTRHSGDFVAHAISDGSWMVSIGASMEAIVGSVRPHGDGWEAIRHRPVRNHEGGVYSHMPPLVLGTAVSIEEAMDFFQAPINPMDQAYLMDKDTGTPLCPLHDTPLDGAADDEALTLFCPRCEYRARLLFVAPPQDR
jgi:hypothetical protein